MRDDPESNFIKIILDITCPGCPGLFIDSILLCTGIDTVSTVVREDV